MNRCCVTVKLLVLQMESGGFRCCQTLIVSCCSLVFRSTGRTPKHFCTVIHTTRYANQQQPSSETPKSPVKVRRPSILSCTDTSLIFFSSVIVFLSSDWTQRCQNNLRPPSAEAWNTKKSITRIIRPPKSSTYIKSKRLFLFSFCLCVSHILLIYNHKRKQVRCHRRGGEFFKTLTDRAFVFFHSNFSCKSRDLPLQSLIYMHPVTPILRKKKKQIKRISLIKVHGQRRFDLKPSERVGVTFETWY